MNATLDRIDATKMRFASTNQGAISADAKLVIMAMDSVV